MEQGQFWMWTKRKYSMSSSSSTKPSCNSYDDSSWEEQAFAEDASGPLGGCIWPPRSYTCSFCRREFRSAQALGGHMNVHRRDRARLKQPSSPQHNHHELQIQNPPNSLMGFLYPYNNNINSSTTSTKPKSVLVTSPSSNKKAYDHSSSSSMIPFPPPQGHTKPKSSYNSPLYYSSPKSNWSNMGESEAEKISKVLDCGCVNNGKADVAFSLNLVVCRGHTSSVEFETKEEEEEEEEEEEDDDDDEEAIIGCKKRRININTTEAPSILPFFPTSNSSVQFSPSSMEELDLELRLGHSRHKV